MCIYIYIYIFIYTCIHRGGSLGRRAWTCVYVCVVYVCKFSFALDLLLCVFDLFVLLLLLYLCMYICIYIYINTYIYICIYIYGPCPCHAALGRRARRRKQERSLRAEPGPKNRSVRPQTNCSHTTELLWLSHVNTTFYTLS